MSRESNLVHATEESPPLILALDTSSKQTGLALSRGGDIIRSELIEADERRSQRLWNDIGRLLEGAGARLEDVAAFAVCIGPGGFTGLRVGLAAVKGLAAATGKPAIGISSLEASAFAAAREGAAVALTGAYKGEIYWQFFQFDEEGIPKPASPPAVGGIEEVIERAADFPSLTWSGDALAGYAERVREVGAEKGWRCVERPANLAEAIAKLAYWKLRRGEAVTAESLRALYVRPAAAEVKLAQGLVGTKLNSLLRS